MNVSGLEFVWVMLNTVTLVFTITALFDARADREAVRILNGRARELAATGIVRRELVRVIVQVLLLSIAVPGLFSDRQTTLSPALAALMAVPVFLLLASFWDARERKRMTTIVAAEALVTKTDAFARIEEALAANTAISQEASDHADAAYKEANSVNEKIANQGAALVKQGEALDADRERNVAAVDTIQTTAAEVHDLHEGTAPEGAT
jgi:hypothetical protein